MNAALSRAPAAITPGLDVPDALAAHWLAQVNIRLRREIAWFWHQRGGRADPGDGSLPGPVDACLDVLDLVRFEERKRQFFRHDRTAAWLSQSLSRLDRPKPSGGNWRFVADALGLDDAACFLLALAVAHRVDAGLGPVLATCANDLNRPWPTAALAQRLWDDPAAVGACLDGDHPLFRTGLLRRGERFGWQEPLEVPGAVAMALCGPARREPRQPPQAYPGSYALEDSLLALSERLAASAPGGLELVVLQGPPGADHAGWAAVLTALSARPLRTVSLQQAAYGEAVATQSLLAWMDGADLLLPAPSDERLPELDRAALRCLDLPLRWFVPAGDGPLAGSALGAARRFDALLPPLGFAQRQEMLVAGLGRAGERLRPELAECARRFRLEAPAVRRVVAELRAVPKLQGKAVVAACRDASGPRPGNATQRVTPRFTGDDLVLPEKQMRLFREIRQAMRTLTEVHYRWGTAKAWNESGLAVLFCGPPGTGKTMAAEALANDLDLELYRTDLSQVVNKYIGETEKNLRRVFDAAEASDSILFFDEADALFGKRTEVKDAHDRFANIEISYLLERMERFKGLAILATNRRKDLDEAFLRRLRHVLEFPMPSADERERIWRASIPAHVDAGELDFRFLARQFAFAGGHIRSVLFNACLQAAANPDDRPLPDGKAGRLTMPGVLVQVRRELDKLQRSAGDELFGSHARAVAEAIG